MSFIDSDLLYKGVI